MIFRWAFFLLWSVSLYGQTVTKVKIIDARDQQPLIGASVQYNGSGAIADLYGEVQLSLSPGKTLKVSYIGYETKSLVVLQEWLDEGWVTVTLEEKVTLLQTATVTSSRYEKPIARATASIDVIKPDFLERNASPSLDEALNRVPGVQIIDGQANIRGGSGWSYGAGSRVMLLLDDLPLLQVDAATTNWSDLPIENVGAVEVVKGASSALYGSSALNGVVHLRSNYAKSEPETEVTIQSSLFDMPNDSTEYRTSHNSLISLVHRRKMGKLDLVLGGMHRLEESFNQGRALRYTRAYAQLRYRLNENLALGVNSMFVPGQSTNFFYWDDYESFRGAESSRTSNARLRFNVDPYIRYFRGQWTHKFLGRYYSVINDNDNDQGNTSTMSYGEYQSQWRSKDGTWEVAAGGVYNHTNSTSELYSDTSFQLINAALYLQLDKRFGDRLTLSGGVRFEYNELRSPEVILGDTVDDGRVIESRPIFRVGGNYKLGQATYLRASWGQGYRFPSIAEKFIDTQAGGLTIRPNVDLESESGWTAELGLRQGLKGDHWNGYLDFTLFRSEYQNMMEFSAAKDGLLVFFQSQNVGAVRIDGLELNGYYSFTRGNWTLNGLFGLTIIDPTYLDWDATGNGQQVTDTSLTMSQLNAAKSTSDENILKYRNRVNAKVDLEARWKGWSTGVNLNRTSQMQAIDRVLTLVIPGMIEDDRVRLEGSDLWALDWRLGYNWAEYQILFSVKNIRDVRYWSRPGYLEAPRTYTLRWGARF